MLDLLSWYVLKQYVWHDTLVSFFIVDIRDTCCIKNLEMIVVLIFVTYCGMCNGFWLKKCCYVIVA